MNQYSCNFYKHRYKHTVYSAEVVFSIVQRIIPRIESAIDIGCGVGAWLNVLKKNGTAVIQGIDGDWVDTDYLEIPKECFLKQDLNNKIKLDKSYDLVISLEVAEHLLPKHAKSFIKQLTQLGECVLFSAAIPGQGGIGHFNEQYPEYWIELFKDNGYVVFDIIRKKIWNDHQIPVHYRQNIFLFVKKEKIPNINITHEMNDPMPFSIVHPQLFKDTLEEHPTITAAFILFLTSIRRKFNKKA